MSGESRSAGSPRRLTGRLVAATHNPGKLREIRELLEPFGLSPVGAAALGLDEPEETGSTFRDNALLKAHAAARASGLVALADDSGLCVEALDGAPGIYSARWAGEAKDFGAAMARVERELEGARRRGAVAGRFHQRAGARLAGWRGGDFRGPGGWDPCLPAARDGRIRL